MALTLHADGGHNLLVEVVQVIGHNKVGGAGPGSAHQTGVEVQ